MQSRRTSNDGFALRLCGIAVAGLMSALIDGTVGWASLADAILTRALQ
jgi:hypothetical protein